MGKRVLYSVFILLMAGSAWAEHEDAWWKFDGDTLDSSGNDRHGTLVGDATLVDIGLWGGAVSLDGSGDYVTIPGYKGINADRSDPDNPSQRAFSVACWIKTTGDGSLVNWGSSDGTGVGGQYQNLRIHGGRLRAEHGNGRFRGAAMVNDGEWHHVVMAVADGANLEPPGTQLYVDGEMDTQGDDTVNSQNIWNLTEDADVGIGVRSSSGDRELAGMFDDVRIYSRQLTAEEVAELALRPKSYAPDPANGAIVGATATALMWTPGGFAAQHAVYFGTTPELSMDDLKGFQADTSFAVTGLEQEQTYYWRIDDVEADGTMITGDTWSFWVEPQRAYDPQPADGLINVATDVQLDWTAGWEPLMHAAYFGTDPDEVANASGALPALETGYDPGPLEKGTTYYWRADAFYAGQWVASPVWSFKTVPEIPPIDEPNLVAWYPLEEGAGRTALDQTGNDRHAAFVGDPEWTEGYEGGGLTLSGLTDKEYIKHALPEASVWPAFTVSVWVKASVLGQRQYSGIFASHVPNSAGFQIDTDGGDPGVYRVNPPGGTTLTFGPVTTEWVHLALTCEDSNAVTYYNGFMGSTGTLTETNVTFNELAFGINRNDETSIDGVIDDARVYDKAFTEEEIRQMFGDVRIAWRPQPPVGTVADVSTITELSWTPGDGAVAHDVYLGSNEMAVKMADTDSVLYQGQQAETTFVPADGFEPGQVYFWRVDEVDADGNVAVGHVWGFSLTDRIIVSTDETVIDYNNIVEPYVTEVAFDVAQNWDHIGLTDSSLEFQGVTDAFVEDADGVITMTGGGADIYLTTDEFRFAYKMLSGDGSITALVESVENTHEWAKGGVMIRASLEPVEVMTHMIATPTNRVEAMQRPVAGQDTTASATEVDSTPLPQWVRITRVGNTFTNEYSADAVTWETLATFELEMPEDVYLGLAVTSHVAGTLGTSVLSNVTMTGDVSGDWHVIDIGVDQGGNTPAPLYVAVEDAAGGSTVVVHPDLTATAIVDWTEWRIPLADLAAAGIDLTAITKVAVGVGDGQPDGTGTVMIRNIQVVKPAANIIWVSDMYDDDDDGVPDDQPWVDLLIAQGYNVDYTAGEAPGNGYWRTLDDDKLAALNAADLVIVSRNSDSANYNNGDEGTQWNSITTPLIQQTAYLVRNNRWKWLDTSGTNDSLPTMQAMDLTHPIFAGVNVDSNGQLEAAAVNVVSFANSADVGNGTALATRVDNGEIWIATWDTGVEFYDGAGQTAGGPRVWLASGTHEGTGEGVGRGENNMTAEGEKIFLNAVKMLLP